MASLAFIIGVIGNIISILVYISPIKTFHRVVKRKSTENYQAFPYITTLLGTSLWTFYGFLKTDGLLVVTVNGTGAFFQFIYVTLFLIYAPNDKRIKAAKLVALLNVGFLGAVIAVTLLVLHGKLRVNFVGFLCAGFTVIVYGAPLSAMKTVIKSKSVEFMPFMLTFTLFLNAGIWLIYAVVVKDIFMEIPSVLGVLLGIMQFILYAMYKNYSTSAKSMEMEEEGLDLKGDVDMHKHNNNEDDDNNKKIWNNRKGKSLPKPPLNRQYSLKKKLRTVSLNSYDFFSDWQIREAHVDNIAKIDDLP